jgi:hypothetical protein
LAVRLIFSALAPKLRPCTVMRMAAVPAAHPRDGSSAPARVQGWARCAGIAPMSSVDGSMLSITGGEYV